MDFFFNDTATTEIYTLSLHDALPISAWRQRSTSQPTAPVTARITLVTAWVIAAATRRTPARWSPARSEEHTSELQSRQYLVCRLLLEKKTKRDAATTFTRSSPRLALF